MVIDFLYTQYCDEHSLAPALQYHVMTEVHFIFRTLWFIFHRIHIGIASELIVTYQNDDLYTRGKDMIKQLLL